MDHVASVPSATSGRMRPEAMGLALVLHAVAALALWYLAAHAPTILPKEDPIEVTIERPKPPEPPPPPPPQAPPKPIPPPPVEGLKPPAEIEADKPTQVRPSGEQEKDVAAAAPPSMEQPRLEKEVPPPPPPPPGPAVTSIPTPTRPPPPAPHVPNPQPRPSPLVPQRPTQQAPSVARRQEMPTPPSSPFVNPADEKNRATAEQNYLWQVVSKLRGYRYHADVPVREGLTVVMVTIARDGRLLDAQVVRSSGIAAMDQGVLAGIRQGSPYAPLPASLSGPSARFRLPLVSVPEER